MANQPALIRWPTLKTGRVIFSNPFLLSEPGQGGPFSYGPSRGKPTRFDVPTIYGEDMVQPMYVLFTLLLFYCISIYFFC